MNYKSTIRPFWLIDMRPAPHLPAAPRDHACRRPSRPLNVLKRALTRAVCYTSLAHPSARWPFPDDHDSSLHSRHPRPAAAGTRRLPPAARLAPIRSACFSNPISRLRAGTRRGRAGACADRPEPPDRDHGRRCRSDDVARLRAAPDRRCRSRAAASLPARSAHCLERGRLRRPDGGVRAGHHAGRGQAPAGRAPGDAGRAVQPVRRQQDAQGSRLRDCRFRRRRARCGPAVP